MQRVALFLASSGFVGFVPIASGTAGSLAGLAVYAVLRLAGSAAFEVAVTLGLLLIGVWAAELVEREHGKDPGIVVIDEVVGMLVTLALLDVTIAGAIVGFVLFRLLDVIKPFPANRFEGFHGGLGIMLDDVMAGIYGNVLMRGLIAVFPGVLA